MSRPSVTVPLPSLDAGLVVNLFAVAGLATICTMLAFLTDWRWGGLLAGVFTFTSATYVSHQMARAGVEDVALDNVEPIRKAS